MKIVERCGECGFYDFKRHKCKRGAHVENDPKSPYYDDCPLPDAPDRKKGEWKSKDLDGFRKYEMICPFCGSEYVDNYDGYIDAYEFNFCPNCGAELTK